MKSYIIEYDQYRVISRSVNTEMLIGNNQHSNNELQ